MHSIQRCRRWGSRGASAPQVLGYQLTLFGPRGEDYARHITTGPPYFWTMRHLCRRYMEIRIRLQKLFHPIVWTAANRRTDFFDPLQSMVYIIVSSLKYTLGFEVDSRFDTVFALLLEIPVLQMRELLEVTEILPKIKMQNVNKKIHRKS